jgi:E3 ubiquitin-protein ligase DMA1/2
MLEGANSTYPQFQCPNCRAYTDLSAEVDLAEEDLNEWMEDAADEDEGSAVEEDQSEMVNGTNNHDDTVQMVDDNAQQSDDAVVVDAPPVPANNHRTEAREVVSPGLLARRRGSNPGSPEIGSINAIDMPGRRENGTMGSSLQPELMRTVSPNTEDIIAGEGPLTPRNNAGPFVFDGSAGRDARRLTVPSIHE